MQTTREKEYPPEQSMSGKNAFYHPCDVRGGRPHYGVCLFTIDAFEQGRLQGTMEDCGRAIKSGECPALAKRAEERKAGKALYYVERNVPIKVVEQFEDKAQSTVDKNSPSYLRGFNPKQSVKRVATSKPVSCPKRTQPKKAQSDFDKGVQSVQSAAEVINDVVEQETKPAADTASVKRNARAMAAKMFSKRG